MELSIKYQDGKTLLIHDTPILILDTPNFILKS